MGLDLRLLPFDADGYGISYSHTILDCERRGDLFEVILEVPAHDVPENFHSFVSRDDAYEDNHYGITVKTPYGEPLQYIRVGTLLAFSNHVDVLDNWKNRAIWAYLKELPPDTKVALYWC